MPHTAKSGKDIIVTTLTRQLCLLAEEARNFFIRSRVDQTSIFHVNLIHERSFANASHQPLKAADEIACRAAFAFKLNGALTSAELVALGEREDNASIRFLSLMYFTSVTFYLKNYKGTLSIGYTANFSQSNQHSINSLVTCHVSGTTLNRLCNYMGNWEKG